LRTAEAQIGHALAAGSVNDWTNSNLFAHSALVQAY
jgi:hypothetical protein